MGLLLAWFPKFNTSFSLKGSQKDMLKLMVEK